MLSKASKSPLRLSDDDKLADEDEFNHDENCINGSATTSTSCIKNDDIYYLSKKRRRLQSGKRSFDLRKKSQNLTNFNETVDLLPDFLTTNGGGSEEGGNETKLPLRKNGLFFSGNAQASSGVIIIILYLNLTKFAFFYTNYFFSQILLRN